MRFGLGRTTTEEEWTSWPAGSLRSDGCGRWRPWRRKGKTTAVGYSADVVAALRAAASAAAGPRTTRGRHRVVGRLDAGHDDRVQVRVARRVTDEDARFKVFGCSAAIASASLVADGGRGAGRARRIEAVTGERWTYPKKAGDGGAGGDAARAAIDDWRAESWEPGPALAGEPVKVDMIEITESAARVITASCRRAAGGGLRVAVKAGGCSGYSYVFDWAPAAKARIRCSTGRAARGLRGPA